MLILIRLYKSCILPLLECSSQVWNPYLKKDICKIESVQKLFTRMVYYRSLPDPAYPRSLPSYQERLRNLGLKSLFYRRLLSDLFLGFKILRGEVRLRASDLWTFRPVHIRRACFNITCPIRTRKLHSPLENSFATRASVILNKLPAELISVRNSSQLRRLLRNVNLLELLNIEDVS